MPSIRVRSRPSRAVARRTAAAGAALASALAVSVPVAAQATRVRAEVPTPASVIGFTPGTDRKLPTWRQVTDYFTALDAASPRVMVKTLGLTTLGRPFLVAFIGDSATLADLPRYRQIQRKLADPRLQEPGERARLLADDKLVVLITSSIHSTEVGGILTPLDLAYRLATAEDSAARRIRATTLVLLVPSLNPDGVDIVGNWYRSTLGTPYEGSGPPELYHHYTGHDNNRDWYAFTQVETQMVVDSLYGIWHPAIVNDIHQQGTTGSRIFIPPYMDPVEPNIDPILTAGVNAMGMAVAWRLTTEGKTGVATDASYDSWTPARAFSHYHAGIRILTETASAALASPITMPFDSLRLSRGYDPRVMSWNFVSLWPGGRWTIGDIVDYQTSASWALLEEAARNRPAWLESFARVGERAVMGREAPGREAWPVAFIIPEAQPDASALRTMLRILQRGQVEVRRTTAVVGSGSVRYPVGSYILFTAQPYGAFAKALLEVQHYPDLREFPGGPPKRPYDVTAQTLPLLMGVNVSALTGKAPEAVTDPIGPVEAPVLEAPGLTDGTRHRRIAIYKSYASSMDEGWTRWLFDQFRIPFTTITDRDVRAGGLDARFDAIVLPDESPAGLARGAVSEAYPDSLKLGIGAPGAAALRAFVSRGGTLIALNRASDYAIEALGLPVRDVLLGVASKDFYGPGSLLRVTLNRAHWMTGALAEPPAIWFEASPAFAITDAARATAVLSYPPAGNPLLSGWLLGGARLNGRAAVVDVRQDQGHVILFGMRPQYRGQSMATYPLLWRALLGSG